MPLRKRINILPTPPITRANFATATEYHDNVYQNADGTCLRWRGNGRPQLWHTRPTHFRQPVKHGLREYGNITHTNGDQLHRSDDCPYHDHD